MKRFVLALVAATAAFASTSTTAFAQGPAPRTDSDTQTFTVTVPAVISITAPVDGSGATVNPTITHDQTDANQTFGSQTWTAACNLANGADVDFEITPFANGTTRRNATLAVALSSSDAGSGWALASASASDTTDISQPTPNASVSYGSSAPGNATFGVVVTFVDSDYSLLPEGDFTATVTGTITEVF